MAEDNSNEVTTALDPAALCDLIAERIPRATESSLVASVISLVTEGTIPPGTKLPTVRQVSDRLNLSASSVGQAWKRLREENVVATRTKLGTTVLGAPRQPLPQRFALLDEHRNPHVTEIGVPNPDPQLFPDLPAALQTAASGVIDLHSPKPIFITPKLQAAVAPGWPIPASRLLALHNGLEAIEMVLLSRVRRDDRIAVEDPTLPRFLDLVEMVGAVPYPVPWTEDGPSLSALQRALAKGCKYFIYQPHAQTPTGASASSEWATGAAALLEEYDAYAIEYDGHTFLTDQPRLVTTVGKAVPERCLHIRSYRYSHGYDTRVAVAGGSNHLITELTQRLNYSSRWVSRLMQDALATMLTDTTSRGLVSRARTLYLERHANMRDSLERHGVTGLRGEAPSLWIPVADDSMVVKLLAERGIGVVSAHSFEARVSRQRYIHVHTAGIKSQVDHYASEIAAVLSETSINVKRQRRELRLTHPGPKGAER